MAGDGKELKLNGVNLGGWLMWEGWIWGGSFKKETFMRERMEILYGREQTKEYIEAYRNAFITEADIKAIATVGWNTVRVPINHDLLQQADGSPRKEGYMILDSLLSWCGKYKVYAVLDVHGAPGGQSPYFIADPDKNNLWKDEAQRKSCVELWKEIAARYKDSKIIAGYDLLNEPVPPKDEDLLNLYKRLVPAIREVDQNHMLILEGSKFARKFDFFTEPLDPNQIFSFHCYTWFTKHPEKSLAELHAFTQKVKRPLWCGEWGEQAPEKLKLNYALFNSPAYNFCGTSIWTWKKVEKGSGKAYVNNIQAGDKWIAVVKYLCGKGPRPTADDAKAGMESFLKAIRKENNIANQEMLAIFK